MDYKVLHIISQEYPHESAMIVGNKSGLEELKNTIEKVLSNQSKRDETDTVFVIDGEGYSVIIRQEEDEEVFNQLDLPYTCDWWDKK